MASMAWQRGQVVRFALVGVASTVLYLALYLLLRRALDAQPANLLALLICALTNTAVNRRVTFGVAGRTTARMHAQGLAVFALGAGLTSAALALLHAVQPDAGSLLEATVLVLATAVATAVRFVLFSRWIFATPAAPMAPAKLPGSAGRPDAA
ncbi:MAG: GtrA family protein [Marmoricola sp.]